MLNVAFDLKNQIISDLEYSSNFEKISYENLLIMGMGGSGVAGDVMKILSNEISDKNIFVQIKLLLRQLLYTTLHNICMSTVQLFTTEMYI